jgi:YVTN family beta-propeller protein
LPVGVAVDAAAHTVYVTNLGDNTVSVINEATNTVTGTIPVGSGPYGVAVDPAARTVYVTNNSDNTVSVINEATSTVTRTIPVGSGPVGVAVDPATRTVFVINTGDNTVSVINEATNTVFETVPVDSSGPVGVAADPATQTVYVANWGYVGNPRSRTVSVLSRMALTTVTTVTSSPNPSTFGRAVTLTAAVTSADGGGTVEFKDGAAGLRGCAARPLRLAAGHYQATCTIGRLPAGKDTITAVYAGDTAYATSTSSPLTQTVRRAPTRLTTDVALNDQHTLTVNGTLTSLGSPLDDQRLTFSTGAVKLCTAATYRNGIASCVLTYAQSAAIRRNRGRYTVSYTGTPGYYPATAHGHATIP